MDISQDLKKYFARIEDKAEKTAGIITTKQIEDTGVYRGMIGQFVEAGFLVRESKGVYSLADHYPDEYMLIQVRSEKMIFSYGTALYLWGMSDRVPHIIDVSVPQGYNGSRIIKDIDSIRLHYVRKDKWDIGITETNTIYGNKVRLYDRERCICDLIMLKKEVDKQLYVQAIREYFKGKPDNRKILGYAKQFHIEEMVRDYMDILV